MVCFVDFYNISIIGGTLNVEISFFPHYNLGLQANVAEVYTQVYRSDLYSI